MTSDLIARVLAALLALGGAVDSQQQQNHDTIAAIQALLERARLEIQVPAGADLQAAIDTAPDGATLFLPAGVTFTGHYTCRGHLTLTTAGVAFGEGYRVTLADGALLATLRTPDNQPALQPTGGSHGCRFVAIQVIGAHAQGTAIAIGVGTETSLDQLPADVDLLNVVVLGDAITGLKRCIALNGINVRIEGSHVAGCRAQGQDSQAIAGWNGPGPYLIANNYLEAGSEVILFGGDRTRIADLVPSDITVTGNTITRPVAWKTLTGLNIKNLVELKNARHVRLAGNQLSNNWAAAQDGNAVLLTPRNQYGDNPWSVVEDVTIDGNTLTAVSSGFNIAGEDDLQPSQRTNRIVLRNNRIFPSRATMGGDGRCVLIQRSPQQLTIDHNTCLNDGLVSVYVGSGGLVSTTAGFVFTDNLLLHQRYSAFSGTVEYTGNPITTLARFFPGAVWSGNVIGGARAQDYPPGTIALSLVDFQAGFLDYAKGLVNPSGVLAGKGAPP